MVWKGVVACDVCPSFPDARQKNRPSTVNKLSKNVCLRFKKAACHNTFREYYDRNASWALIIHKFPLLRSRLCENKSRGLVKSKKKTWMFRWFIVHRVMNQWLTSRVSHMRRNQFARVLFPQWSLVSELFWRVVRAWFTIQSFSRRVTAVRVIAFLFLWCFCLSSDDRSLSVW